MAACQAFIGVPKETSLTHDIHRITSLLRLKLEQMGVILARPARGQWAPLEISSRAFHDSTVKWHLSTRQGGAAATLARPAGCVYMRASMLHFFIRHQSPAGLCYALAGAIGLAAQMIPPDHLWFAAIAIGIAIALMAVLLTTQPPAGAVRVIAYAATHGLGFPAFPILPGAAGPVLVACLYQKLTGRAYPLRPSWHA